MPSINFHVKNIISFGTSYSERHALAVIKKKIQLLTTSHLSQNYEINLTRIYSDL